MENRYLPILYKYVFSVASVSFMRRYVKWSTWRPTDFSGFPACLAFIRTLFVGCRCPVHVSVRVRRCYLELEFSLGSIGGALIQATERSRRTRHGKTVKWVLTFL